MRKGATRGLINITFMEYSGVCEIYNRKTAKHKKQPFKFLVTKTTNRNDLHALIENNIGVASVIVLNVTNVEIKELVYSMDKDTFLANAKVL